jgi:hypothetical protein
MSTKNSMSLDPILSQMNQVHYTITHFSKIKLILSSHYLGYYNEILGAWIFMDNVQGTHLRPPHLTLLGE